MRKLLLATAASLVLAAAPAAARDGSGYIGIEGGFLFPQGTDIDIDTLPGVDGGEFDSGLELDYKTGLDADLIAGYDFGAFRVEGELGYKRAKLDEFDISPALRDLLEDELGGPVTDDDLDLDGSVKVTSAMLNGLLDFGGDAGIGGFVGAGIGVASVDYSGVDDSDSALSWQLLAGIRAPVSDSIDVGVKYRYFRTGKLDFGSDFDGAIDSGLRSRFTSHSLLASLIFNFGTPAAAPMAPPPPPPPPAPAPAATITCPDGSVILATSSCPLPPPPPPPPPMTSGERGQ